jgi:hypothetical protein
MHRSAEGKSANRTLDVETGLANIQAVNFELDVVGPNHEATGFKRRAHIFSHHTSAQLVRRLPEPFVLPQRPR